MSTLNDIFKKIEDKTELSSHQVELARLSIDEIRKSYDSVLEARNQSTAALRKAKEASTAISNSAKSLSVRSSQFLKDYEVFSNDVKTLGLEVPANLTGLNDVVKGDVKLVQQLNKAANTIANL
jgi:uncharacterized phage infection (PIP) family protein YhgE